jgi:hypothetical protein
MENITGVVIGSAALAHYKTDQQSGDLDALILPKFEKEFNNLKNKCKTFLLDYKVITENSSDQLILNYCQKNNCRIVKFFDFNFYLPPLELLYIIKKSHICRIINNVIGFDKIETLDNGRSYGHDVSSFYDKNIQIWLHQITMYNWMLEHTSPDQITADLIQIYMIRFDETVKKVGDTKINMRQNSYHFFRDKVVRYFDHDFLHVRVAHMERKTNELLFTRLLVPDTVELSKDKFNEMFKADQIQMIREEIMVLFLERVIIPILMEEYKDSKLNPLKLKPLKFQGLNYKWLNTKLEELIVHYITNMTGSGHYWLRQYCINNSKHLLQLERYKISELEKLACQICDIKYNNIKQNDNIIQNKPVYKRKYIYYSS